MFVFSPVTNPLIDAIQYVSDSLKDAALNQESLNQCESQLEAITDFFNCSQQQGVALALLLQLHFNNTTPSIKEIVDFLDIKVSMATQLNELLQPFVTNDWLQPVQQPCYFPLTDYTLNPRFIRCVVSNSWDAFAEPDPVIENDLQFLNYYGKRISAGYHKIKSFGSFAEKMSGLLRSKKSLQLSKFVRSLKLTETETCIFLYCCFWHYKHGTNFDLERIDVDLKFTQEEKYIFRTAIRNKTSFLYTKNLLTDAEEEILFTAQEFQLTEKAIRSFDRINPVGMRKNKSTSLKQLLPAAISVKTLIYESEAESSIAKLTEMLSTQNFQKITTRLKDQGMKAGVSVLLYGFPGTGKTETVLQLARINNRPVLMADISKIRDKWVGNTEKNIKALFEDYRKSVRSCKQTPILLFNEADAILGKRREVNDRADQMENNLQNILLEEMENFEGILIATTNLEENLDTAFDRRFLYKVRFEKPSDQTAFQIWKTKFPEIDETVLKNVSATYRLTGGQIENIHKKITVDALLNSEFGITESYLLQLANQELVLKQKQKRSPIGFVTQAG